LGSIGSLVTITQENLRHEETFDRICFSSEIVATDDDSGKVFIYGRMVVSSNAQTIVAMNPTGIVGFDNTSFSVVSSALNTFEQAITFGQPFAPNREATARGPPYARRIYDAASGRLYLTSLAIEPFNGRSGEIRLMYTDDDGHTWSDPVVIVGEAGVARGTVNMVMDTCDGSPTYGYLLVTWLDARNDPDPNDQSNVDWYMAIVNPADLPALSGSSGAQLTGGSSSGTAALARIHAEQQAARLARQAADDDDAGPLGLDGPG
jgi:hypothetical protein